MSKPNRKRGNFAHALTIIRRYHPEVVAVKDAERNIYVEVDGRMVRGASAAPDKCPLAKACKAEMELDGALISRGVCYTIRKGLAERYVPTGITRTMLRRFDKTGKFQAGIYQLAIPPPSQAIGAREKRAMLTQQAPPGGGRMKKRTYLINGERRRLN